MVILVMSATSCTSSTVHSTFPESQNWQEMFEQDGSRGGESLSSVEFVDKVNHVLDGLGSDCDSKWFDWATNITWSNQDIAMSSQEELDTFMAYSIISSANYPPQPDNVTRSILLLRVSSPVAPSANADLQRRITTLTTEMETNYATSTVCGMRGHEGECLTLGDLEDILATSRDPLFLLSLLSFLTLLSPLSSISLLSPISSLFSPSRLSPLLFDSSLVPLLSLLSFLPCFLYLSHPWNALISSWGWLSWNHRVTTGRQISCTAKQNQLTSSR